MRQIIGGPSGPLNPQTSAGLPATLDMSASWTSASILCSLASTGGTSAVTALDILTIAVEITVAGSPVGSLKLQGCNTLAQASTSWTDLPNATLAVPPVPSGQPLVFTIQNPAPSFTFIRVVYTRTSGGTADTATISCTGYSIS